MRKPDCKKIVWPILYTALFVLFFSAGGMGVTLFEEWAQSIVTECAVLGGITAAACAVVLLCCRFLLQNKHEVNPSADFTNRKYLTFNLILFSVLVASTLLLMNFAASFVTAPWPMSGLHGVSSSVGEKAWLYHDKVNGFVEANSWGQRDREHTIYPEAGSYRMIFIGDSFLENGAAVPLPMRTEEILKRKGMSSSEVINLGVSATGPDEYFFRLKRIGLPLKPKHCILMFTASNDFIQEPSLLSFGGISATYPRGSFLQILGLYSLDHVISNERRPVLRAWFKGGDLLKHELELREIFGKTVNDQETEQTYLSFFPPEEQAQLKAVLSKSSAADRSSFYAMLRNPDGAQFRSYYLDIATRIAKGLPTPDFIPADYSFRWVKAAAELCRENGVKFTLVVIPEPLTVDSRMIGHYAAIADMRAYMLYKDEAVNRLVSHAAEAGMDVVDLRELLQRHPGAFLNMDGHWSQQGADTVAAFLADRFGKRMPLQEENPRN